MAVAQPSNEYGLWARVRAKAPWPTTNEDLVAGLAADLRTGAGHFAAAGGRQVRTAAWHDDGGQAFAVRMRGNLDAANRTAGDLDRLAGTTERFATVVTDVKTDIRNTVEQNIPVYGTTFQLPAGVAESARNMFVAALADWSNARVQHGAATVTGTSPANNPVADGIRVVADADFDLAFDGIDTLTGTDPVGSAVADRTLQIASGARNLKHGAATALDGKTPPVPVYISDKKYPESAKHVTEAQTGTTWRGDVPGPGAHPSVVTVDRDGAKQNRRDSLRGVPTRDKLDRDEYPPAVFAEGGEGASVKYVPYSDNRGAGASMGNQLRAVEQSVQNQIDGENPLIGGEIDDLPEDRRVVIKVR